MVYLRKAKSIYNSLKANWQDISWWRNAIILIYYKRIIGNKGTHIMQEDWDNLIILDACRYDIFEQLNSIPGNLEFRISRGSATNEFLIENFKGKRFYNTIYITANPLVNYHVSDSFYKIIPVWEKGWSEQYGTALPGTMKEYSLATEEKYPDKRLIIHFVQPHYPFIGEKARKKTEFHTGITGGENALQTIGEISETGSPKQSIWNLAKDGKVNIDTVWEAYKENLEFALPFARELVDKLSGKTVITSDHGNLFGERVPPFFSRYYGHPRDIYAKNLVKVPWLVIESKNRKEITAQIESADAEKARIKGKVQELKARGKI